MCLRSTPASISIDLDLKKFKFRSGLKERLHPSTWISRIRSDTQTRLLPTARHSWHGLWMSHFQDSQICEGHCFIFILIFFFPAKKASWHCPSCKNMINIQTLIRSKFLWRAMNRLFCSFSPAENSGKERHLMSFLPQGDPWWLCPLCYRLHKGVPYAFSENLHPKSLLKWAGKNI